MPSPVRMPPGDARPRGGHARRSRCADRALPASSCALSGAAAPRSAHAGSVLSALRSRRTWPLRPNSAGPARRGLCLVRRSVSQRGSIARMSSPTTCASRSAALPATTSPSARATGQRRSLGPEATSRCCFRRRKRLPRAPRAGGRPGGRDHAIPVAGRAREGHDRLLGLFGPPAYAGA